MFDSNDLDSNVWFLTTLILTLYSDRYLRLILFFDSNL